MNNLKLFKNYKQLITDYIRFKCFLTYPQYKSEIQKVVSWLRGVLENNNLIVKVIKGYGNPIVLAETKHDPTKKTVLIYGHYDVQPASKEEGWSSEPFELVEKKDRFIARGAMDNKGQFLIHLVNILDLFKQNKLKYNIKFLIEGDEEVGSEHLDKFIAKYKKDLSSDFIIISDGPQPKNLPTIETSFRGIANMTISYKALNSDVHSGSFGGVLPNAALELVKLLSGIHKNNRVNVNGFYKGTKQPQMYKNWDYSLEEINKLTGAKAIFFEKGLNYVTQKGLRPSIEITTFNSGYLGEGYRNSIPAKAQAKINIRTVEGQKIKDVISAVKVFIQENTPNYIDYDVQVSGGNLDAVKIDTSSKYFKYVESSLKDVYGQKVIFNPVGGTLPIIKYFQEILKVPVIPVPLANSDSRMHGVDENMTKRNIALGMEFSRRLLTI